MGRPKIEIDEDVVFDLAVKGWTNKEIAAECNCSHDTLERRFASTLKDGHEVLNGRLRAKQVTLALKGDGNATMLIWLGKQRLGQSDKIEQSGEVTVKEASEKAREIFNGRIKFNGHSNGKSAVAGGVHE